MSLWKVAWRSIQQRALASALTAFSMSLGVALVVAVLVIYGVVDFSFKRGSEGYDLVVGAKGDPLLLVLGTVFHLNLNQPLDSIPYSYYEKFVDGPFAGVAKAAVPICAGHDYNNCPVIATTPDMFDRLTYAGDRRYEFAYGQNFDAAKPFEAVAGATAARTAGLKIGDKFKPMAGKPGEGGHQDDNEFEIVGILAPTGTPNDRAIFMNLEGFYACPAHQQGPSAAARVLGGAKPDDAKPADHDHKEADDHADADDHDHEHEHAERKVTAILVVLDTNKPYLAQNLADVINRDQVAQATYPTRVIAKFFDQVLGNIQLLLLIIAVLVVVVAGVGILVSIYNSMSDRRHEIAIMRALGASQVIIMSVILLESILLSLGGGAAGVLLGHGMIGILGPTISDQTGVRVAMWDFQAVELMIIPGLVILATMVGYLPAVVAYRTDVAKSLAAGT